MSDITNIVWNISGNISYSDNSVAPIEVTLAYGDKIASPYSNLNDFAILHRDKAAILADFFNVLYPGLVVLNPNSTVVTKTVRDVILFMSNTSTHSNGTVNNFSVQYINGSLNYVPNTIDANWTDMINFNKPLLQAMFESLVGVGNVVLSLYLFVDCFGSCSGNISNASPGPICGWTFNSAFGPGSSSIALNGSAVITSTSATDYAGMTKSLPDQLIDVDNLSGRFDFSEYSTTPNANTTYQLFINNHDLTKTVVVSFFGDGGAALQFGDISNAPLYLTTWTLTGGTHEVHFVTGDSPALYIDGNQLTLGAPIVVPTFSGSLPANIVGLFGGSGAATTTTSTTTNIFITTENIGPDTILLCQ